MIAHTMRVLRVTAGVSLVAVGIVCVVLPVIPGWPLIIPGLLLLGIDIVKARHWVHGKVVRYPRVHRTAAKFGYRPPTPTDSTQPPPA